MWHFMQINPTDRCIEYNIDIVKTCYDMVRKSGINQQKQWNCQQKKWNYRNIKTKNIIIVE